VIEKDSVDGSGQQSWEGKIAKLSKTFTYGIEGVRKLINQRNRENNAAMVDIRFSLDQYKNETKQDIS